MSEVLPWAWWALAAVTALRATKALKMIGLAKMIAAGADHMKAENETTFFGVKVGGPDSETDE